MKAPSVWLFASSPLLLTSSTVKAWATTTLLALHRTSFSPSHHPWESITRPSSSRLSSSPTLDGDSDVAVRAHDTEAAADKDELPYDYDVPEDAVINIKPKAMRRLRELRDQQQSKTGGDLILRMGVRSGGCSGMSYVMDFSTEEAIGEDDAVDEYAAERIKCVVDSKSLLYLYGLELDYSDELIGGGFKFSNPNAEESCGCGSSFGV